MLNNDFHCELFAFPQTHYVCIVQKFVSTFAMAIHLNLLSVVFHLSPRLLIHICDRLSSRKNALLVLAVFGGCQNSWSFEWLVFANGISLPLIELYFTITLNWSARNYCASFFFKYVYYCLYALNSLFIKLKKYCPVLN